MHGRASLLIPSFLLSAAVLAGESGQEQANSDGLPTISVATIRSTGVLHLDEIRVLRFAETGPDCFAVEASWRHPESPHVRVVGAQQDFSWLFQNGVVSSFNGEYSFDGSEWTPLPDVRVAGGLGRLVLSYPTPRGEAQVPQYRVLRGVEPVPVLVTDLGLLLDRVALEAGQRWLEADGRVWIRVRVGAADFVPQQTDEVPWRDVAVHRVRLWSDEVELRVPPELVRVAMAAKLVERPSRGRWWP